MLLSIGRSLIHQNDDNGGQHLLLCLRMTDGFLPFDDDSLLCVLTGSQITSKLHLVYTRPRCCYCRCYCVQARDCDFVFLAVGGDFAKEYAEKLTEGVRRKSTLFTALYDITPRRRSKRKKSWNARAHSLMTRSARAMRTLCTRVHVLLHGLDCSCLLALSHPALMCSASLPRDGCPPSRSPAGSVTSADAVGILSMQYMSVRMFRVAFRRSPAPRR